MESYNDITLIAQALSDPGRVKALDALRSGELCMCELTELLALAMPTVSRHMAILANAGLVEVRKEGRWRHYRIADAPASLVQSAMDWAFEALPERSAKRKCCQSRK